MMCTQIKLRIHVDPNYITAPPQQYALADQSYTPQRSSIIQGTLHSMAKEQCNPLIWSTTDSILCPSVR